MLDGVTFKLSGECMSWLRCARCVGLHVRVTHGCGGKRSEAISGLLLPEEACHISRYKACMVDPRTLKPSDSSSWALHPSLPLHGPHIYVSIRCTFLLYRRPSLPPQLPDRLPNSLVIDRV